MASMNLTQRAFFDVMYSTVAITVAAPAEEFSVIYSRIVFALSLMVTQKVLK